MTYLFLSMGPEVLPFISDIHFFNRQPAPNLTHHSQFHHGLLLCFTFWSHFIETAFILLLVVLSGSPVNTTIQLHTWCCWLHSLGCISMVMFFGTLLKHIFDKKRECKHEIVIHHYHFPISFHFHQICYEIFGWAFWYEQIHSSST